MPPGLMSRRRNRNSRSFNATFSFERSVVVITTSVTSFGAVAPGFWPLPSGRCWPAGHSPANAAPTPSENAPATTPASAPRRQLLVWVLLMTISFRLLLPRPEKPRDL